MLRSVSDAYHDRDKSNPKLKLETWASPSSIKGGMPLPPLSLMSSSVRRGVRGPDGGRDEGGTLGRGRVGERGLVGGEVLPLTPPAGSPGCHGGEGRGSRVPAGRVPPALLVRPCRSLPATTVLLPEGVRRGKAGAREEDAREGDGGVRRRRRAVGNKGGARGASGASPTVMSGPVLLSL